MDGWNPGRDFSSSFLNDIFPTMVVICSVEFKSQMEVNICQAAGHSQKERKGECQAGETVKLNLIHWTPTGRTERKTVSTTMHPASARCFTTSP